MISFTKEEIQYLASLYCLTLVGTFWYRRPPLAKILSAIDRIGFSGAVKIGLIDGSHVLLHFDHEQDYLRCFTRQSWMISRNHMHVTKWTLDYDPTVEVPIVPAWVCFPGLPIHFHRKDALFQIARMIGTPMKQDASIIATNCPSVVCICVEVDVSKELPQRVYIQGASWIISQQVEYEGLPSYCNGCYWLGHVLHDCGKSKPELPVRSDKSRQRRSAADKDKRQR